MRTKLEFKTLNGRTITTYGLDAIVAVEEARSGAARCTLRLRNGEAVPLTDRLDEVLARIDEAIQEEIDRMEEDKQHLLITVPDEPVAIPKEELSDSWIDFVRVETPEKKQSIDMLIVAIRDDETGEERTQGVIAYSLVRHHASVDQR